MAPVVFERVGKVYDDGTRAVADLSVPDIARALDKPETAVKALLRRASAALSRRLAENGEP